MGSLNSSFDARIGSPSNGSAASSSLVMRTSGDDRLLIDGTTGDISFYNTAGTSQALFWDASAESLGIGTSSPSAKVDLVGGGITGGLKISADKTTSAFFAFGADANETRITSTSYGGYKPLTVHTGGAERMRITSAGNVGIGNSSPDSVLTAVNAASTAALRIGLNNTSFNYMDADYNIFRSGTGTERMRIDSSGNVGIGTASPAQKITVTNNGTAVYSDAGFTNSSSTSALFVGVGGSAVSNTSLRNNAYVLAGNAGSNLILGTDAAEAMRITSAGNVGIGVSSPGYKLAINGNIGLTDGVSTALHVLVGGNYYMQNTGAYSTIFQTAGTERMRIDASGRVGIANSSPSSQYFNNLVVGDNSAGDKGITIRSNASNVGVLAFSDTDSADSGRYSGYIAYDHSNNAMRLHTNGGSERMRIDSSGNVLVGTTQSRPAEFNHPKGISLRGDIGQIQLSTDGNPAMFLNRDTNDGQFMEFRREGTAVGSIGTVASAPYFAGASKSLRIGSAGFYPATNTGAYTDGTIDLGSTSGGARYKDLHLSGTANVGSLLSASSSAGANAFSAGPNAGATNQGISAVAVGASAGQITQGINAVGVGRLAGATTQGASATAIGNQAGQTTQSDYAVAVGNAAGQTTQGASAVAVGQSSWSTTQGASAVAVG